MFELQSCPFCGGKARLLVNNGARVICTKCYASTRIMSDEIEYDSNAVETVINNWNKRTSWPGSQNER